MKQVTKYIGMVAIIAIFTLVTISGIGGEAEAKQAEDSNEIQSSKSYDSATYDISSDKKICEFLRLSPSECKEMLQ